MDGADVVFELPEGDPRPVAAREMIPEWYRSIPAFIDGLERKSTVKMCRPFSDALRSGTLVRSPVDLHVDVTDDGVEVVSDVPEDDLTVYSTEQPPADSNSAFKLPEAKFETPVRWETDEEYLTLVTPPRNRTMPDLRPFSLLVDAGRSPRQLILPLVFEANEVRVDAGDPLAHFWFFRRDSVVRDQECLSFADDREAEDVHDLTDQLIKVKKDVYRSDYWEQKEQPSFTEPIGADPLLSGREDYRPVEFDALFEENADRPMHWYAREENDGLVPEPVPGGEYVPDRYDSLADHFDEHGELLQTWVTSAMRLGFVVPLAADLELRRGEEGTEMRTPFDEPLHHNMIEHMLLTFPLEGLELVNVHAFWSGHSPPGYSNFFTRPLNHFQQDCRVFNGIVDDDNLINTANAPSLVRTPDEDETYSLEKGTAVIQSIPLDRANFGCSIEVRRRA